MERIPRNGGRRVHLGGDRYADPIGEELERPCDYCHKELNWKLDRYNGLWQSHRCRSYFVQDMKQQTLRGK